MSVTMRTRLLLLLLLAGLSSPPALAQFASQQASPRELFQALNDLRVNSKQVYFVRDLLIRRDVVRLSLDEGKLAFLTAYDGRVTGAVFTGRGRALALPRDPIEKASLGRFLGAPLLDQPFSRAYLRFNDSTAEELLRQIRDSDAVPAEEPSFGADWDPRAELWRRLGPHCRQPELMALTAYSR